MTSGRAGWLAIVQDHTIGNVCAFCHLKETKGECKGVKPLASRRQALHMHTHKNTQVVALGLHVAPIVKPWRATPVAARSSTGTTSLAHDLIRANRLPSFGGYTATRSVGWPLTTRPWPLKPLPALGPVNVVTTTRWTCSTAAIARRAGPFAYVPIGASRCCLPLS